MFYADLSCATKVLLKVNSIMLYMYAEEFTESTQHMHSPAHLSCFADKPCIFAPCTCVVAALQAPIFLRHAFRPFALMGPMPLDNAAAVGADAVAAEPPAGPAGPAAVGVLEHAAVVDKVRKACVLT
jgi:hypothetical protein